MNGLDLFSGIGGLTKALDGYVRPVAYCENDRYAQSVLLSRMCDGDLPKAPIWDDVRSLSRNHLDAQIEIIYGGFPCQDISVAGRGAGLEGKRSGLFFEIARLVGEIRPRFVFLENVSAITVRGSERVVGELCRLGYDCRWGILSAYDVGAPHQRDRWWLLAHAMSPRRDEREGKIKKNDVDDTRLLGSKECQIKTAGVKQSGWWTVEPNVGRVAHGIPLRVDRLRGLGNAVVPAQAREAFERLMGLKET